MDAIFIPQGNVFEPTELAVGPWDPRALHGGAPAALVARAMEREGGDWPFVRVDVHFVKPVPRAPLAVSVALEREGRRARRLRTEVRVGGDLVCFAEGLQLRPGDDSVPAVQANARALAPPSAGSPAVFKGIDHPMFGGEGVQVNVVDGAFDTPGPAAGWFRLRVPLVAGEEPTPLQRTMAAADFGNGLSWEISWNEYTFVNPELTVYLVRQPAGEWIAIDSRTTIDPAGVGLSESVIHDEQGPIGRALQALYVSRR